MTSRQIQIAFGGLTLSLLILGGIFFLYTFQHQESVYSQLTAKQEAKESRDPLIQLLGENIKKEQRKKFLNTQKKGLKANFFESPSPLLDMPAVEKFSGKRDITSIQSCLKNSPKSAKKGFIYAELDTEGMLKILEEKSSKGKGDFLKDVHHNLQGQFEYAINNNQLHWYWNEENNTYIFYTYKGDEQFWYCYLKEGNSFFSRFFQTGENTDQKSLYYTAIYDTSLPKSEINIPNPYPMYSEEEWGNTKNILGNITEGIAGQSTKEFLKSVANISENSPLRITADGTPLYRRNQNQANGLYKNNETGQCFIASSDLKNTNYIPVSNCTDTLETGNIYSVEIIPQYQPISLEKDQEENQCATTLNTCKEGSNFSDREDSTSLFKWTCTKTGKQKEEKKEEQEEKHVSYCEIKKQYNAWCDSEGKHEYEEIISPSSTALCPRSFAEKKKELGLQHGDVFVIMNDFKNTRICEPLKTGSDTCNILPPDASNIVKCGSQKNECTKGTVKISETQKDIWSCEQKTENQVFVNLCDSQFLKNAQENKTLIY